MSSTLSMHGDPYDCPICKTKTTIEVLERKNYYDDVQCQNCKWNICFITKYENV